MEYVSQENPRVSISFKNNGNLLANAVLTIETKEYGNITIKGFQIWKSKERNKRLQEAINISPPSIRVFGGRYLKQIFFEDKEAWCRLEDEIYNAYRKSRSNLVEDEYINPKDVPI